MSWLTKAESILNKLDQSAGTLLQQKTVNDAEKETLFTKTEESSNSEAGGIRRIPSKNNVMVLKSSTPKKKKKQVIDPEEKILDILNNSEETHSQKSQKYSDRQSDTSSISRHETVVDKNDDQSSVASRSMISSTTSLQQPSAAFFSAEKELAATKIVLEELKLERDELKQELESLMETVKNNNNQNKLVELEELCNQLLDEKENLVKISQTLETSNINYIKTISELESTISKHLQNENDLMQKLDYSKNETSHAMNELAQYRSRAQSTLQMKEKIIEQLRSGQHDSTGSEKDVVEATLIAELEQLKSERQNLQSEIKSLTSRYEESRKYIENLEAKHLREANKIQEKYKNMEDQANQINLKCSHYEDEIRDLKQEIAKAKDELISQKTSLTIQLHEKDAELTKLRKSTLTRPAQSTLESENRIQSLTQSLIAKQNVLENVTAERNALRLQMEKLTNQHEETLTQIRLNRPQIINQTSINMNMNETDDAKSQVPNFMMENPFDTRISRRVKRAYSSLDSVGIRLGVFLRRYPLVRISAICYICFLHIWVIFILLSSTPNIK